MSQGRQVEFGPKEETLAKVLKRATPTPMPLKVVHEIGSATA